MIVAAQLEESRMNLSALLKLATLALVLVIPAALASDTEDLQALLDEFLANVDEEATHDRFWATDLIYSSSTGSRFGKAEIMEGFAVAGEEAADAPATTYSADDVQVNVYGDTAVVAFKLVAVSADGSETQYYFNTGTFVKRDGKWQAVAWQATKIPPADTSK